MMTITALIRKLLGTSRKREIWFVFCLIFLGVGTLVFAKLTDDYLDQEDWVRFDQPIITWVYQLRNPVLSRLMLLITLSGNWQMIILGTVMVMIVLVRSHHWRYFWVLLITNSAAITFIELLKHLIGRQRPPMEMAIVTQSSFSFPSGHSYFAGVYYGLLVYFLARHLKNRWLQLGTLMTGGVTVLTLAFSRVYLGVHWPTDVVAGLASGSVWLVATIMFLEVENMFLGKREKRVYNKKETYGLIVAMGVVWVLTLGLMYSTQNINAANLGAKTMAPTTKAASAVTRTAPAAASRILVVSE